MDLAPFVRISIACACLTAAAPARPEASPTGGEAIVLRLASGPIGDVARARGLVVERCLRADRDTWLVRPRPGIDAAGLVTALSSDPRVLWAEVDRILDVEMQRLLDDPLLLDGSQWYLDNWGQTGLAPDVDVQAPEAWDSWIGEAATAVMYLDSGVEGTHPDLRPNIWINAGEVPPSFGIVDADSDGVLTFDDLDSPVNAGLIADRNGNGVIDPTDLVDDAIDGFGLENGIDDDGNGYVDDVVGIGFRDGIVTNDPYDPELICHEHGTEVTGMSAARGDDGWGMTGACPRCRIFGAPVPPCEPVAASVVAEFFDYAADNGFTAVNDAWHGSGALPQVLGDAFDAAWESGRGGRGTLVFFSAGNGHPDESVDDSPFAAHPRTMAVGAVDAAARKASYSAEGQALDFCTLGVGVGTPGTVTTTLGGGHAVVLGATSEACGLASGIGALLSSAMPALKPEKIRHVLRATARKVGPASDYDPATGHSTKTGYGLLQAGAALDLASPGHVLLDRLTYDCDGGVIEVSIRAAEGLGERLAIAWSATEPAGETVRCVEVARRPDLYEGVLAVSRAPSGPDDGVLSVTSGDEIHVRYDGVAPVEDSATVTCACASPTGFGGITQTEDLDACAGSGVRLAWDAPDDWGQGGPGWYHVHRSADPGFEPGDANRLVTLPWTETTWTDIPPQANVDWSYAVVAESAGPGCPGPGGGAVDASPPVPFVVDVELFPPAAVESLRVERGPGDWAVVTWVPGEPAPHDVRRGPLPIDRATGLQTECAAARVAGTGWIDSEPPGTGFAYLVAAVSECGASTVGVDSFGTLRERPAPCP